MTNPRDEPSGTPINADTGTPIPHPTSDPEVPPLREDYGGPRTASDGDRVSPDATEVGADVTPLLSDDGVESRGTGENFGPPAHSRTGEDDAEHEAGRSGTGEAAGWESTSMPSRPDAKR